MTIDDQILKIKDYCDEMLKADPEHRLTVRKEFLWKIGTIAKDLLLLDESGDRSLSEP